MGKRKPRAHLCVLALLTGGLTFFATVGWPLDDVQAKVFPTKAEALEAAFPEADEVQARHHFLKDAQAARVEELGKVKLDSLIVTFYVALEGGRPIGYAYIDTHIVRTMPEALLLVLSTEGRLESVLLLAFHEPPEYEPPERWLAQFRGKSAPGQVRLKQDVDSISGATMTSEAVTNSVRRVLALFRVLYGEG